MYGILWNTVYWFVSSPRSTLSYRVSFWLYSLLESCIKVWSPCIIRKHLLIIHLASTFGNRFAVDCCRKASRSISRKPRVMLAVVFPLTAQYAFAIGSQQSSLVCCKNRMKELSLLNLYLCQWGVLTMLFSFCHGHYVAPERSKLQEVKIYYQSLSSHSLLSSVFWHVFLHKRAMRALITKCPPINEAFYLSSLAAAFPNLGLPKSSVWGFSPLYYRTQCKKNGQSAFHHN